MARLYQDGAGLTYNSAAGKFESVPFSTYTPYDFSTDNTYTTGEEALQARVDNSLVGNMMDCGECHVGGGGMQYMPRNATAEDGTTEDRKTGTLKYKNRIEYGSSDFLTTVTGYTAFNYFIDVFDVDKDYARDSHGYLNRTDVATKGTDGLTEALKIDFAKTGVMEMDCLVCHLKGYSWEDRKHEVRQAKFAASRVSGAGLGTVVEKAWGQAGYGTTVAYNANNVVAVDENDPSKGYKLAPEFAANIVGTPATDNCASCHQGHYQVDWKKRGEMRPELDVHGQMGCMSCHQRKDTFAGSSDPAGDVVGVSGASKEKKLALCDPAKGTAGPWDNLQNKLDGKAFKTCEDCHLPTGDLGTAGRSYSAPDPTLAHTVAGLMDNKVQKIVKDADGKVTKGMDGVANGNHLDILSCEACHINKKQTYIDENGKEVPVTGGLFVDGSAPDHEGRLATHDTPEVSRDMSTDSAFGYNWANDGKIHPGNYLTSFFWRDKNDVDFDVNNDKKPHGMDAVLPTHIAKSVGFDPAKGLFSAAGPNGKDVTVSEVSARSADLKAVLDPDSTNGAKIKLSFVTVPFTMSHQIAPAAEALGAGGCTDCHGAANGIFNGVIDLSGDNSIAWDSETQMAPMTKVNGMTEKTYLHPKQKDKFLARSIAGNLAAGGTLIDLPRKAALYEETFQTRKADWESTITGGVITMPDASKRKTSTKGWLLKLEVKDGNGDITTRTAMIKKDIATVAGLVNSGVTDGSLPANFTDCNNKPFGFCVQAVDTDETSGVDAIQISTKADHTVRVHPASSASSFKLAGYLWETKAWTGTDNNTYATRDAWVAYLNSIGAAPSAVMTNVGGTTSFSDTNPQDGILDEPNVIELTLGESNLEALAHTAGDYTYTWSCTDGGSDVEGASTSRFFNVPGTFSLRLAVKNNNTGAVDTFAAEVKVAAAPVTVNETMTGAYDTTVEGEEPTLNLQSVPANTNRLVVIWGDGKRQVFKDVDLANPPTLQHTFQTFGDYTGSFITEVRAIDYPDGGLLAVAEVSLAKSTLDGGTVSIADAVTITGVRIGDTQYTTTGGVTTNIDLVTIEGTRATGKAVNVTCVDSTTGNLDNPKVGSVYYLTDQSWSVDVELSEDTDNTCTATVGTDTDSAVLNYTPATGAPDMPTDLDFGTPAVRGSLMDVTLTGTYTGTSGNTVDVTVNYPSDANVGAVSTDESAKTFSVFISDLLHIDNNYVTVKEVDTAGNDSQGNYFTIQEP